MKKNEVEYPIPIEDLHRKNWGKYTLRNIIIQGKYCTESIAGKCYHYTSPEGLKGILSTRTLFFTDCQFLNDYRERMSINEELRCFWEWNKEYYDSIFVNLLKDIRVKDYEDYEYSYMESDEPYGMPPALTRYFVLSTSLVSDSLNMWKYYSKNNTYDGYCIELKTYALTDEWIYRDTEVAIEDGKVLYYRDEKQSAIKKAVDKLYEVWCTYKISDALNKKLAADFRSWVSVAALFFKDECFADEYEYRFIAIVPIGKLNEIFYTRNEQKHKMYDFRIVNGGLTPYIKMPFNLFMKDKCWDIKSIGISPSQNSYQKEYGLNLFMASLDYEFEDCKIYHSKIPLRY